MNKNLQLTLPGRKPPFVMAHRGDRVHCPENTLPAFEKALADGADILETDLHVSSDGVFMCIHDGTLDRTTDGSGAVEELTLGELKKLSAAYGRNAFEGVAIPTLKETAAILPADRALALELKSDAFLDPQVAESFVSEMDHLGIRDRVLLLSFSQERLRAVAEQAPGLPCGLISMARVLPPAGFEVSGVFWPFVMINPLYVWISKLRGQLFCPLDPTPDSRLPIYRLLGCDAVLSDDPGSTIKAMVQMGWREEAAYSSLGNSPG
jgi:glycerophosphoryl diester phosphodiesterase